MEAHTLSMNSGARIVTTIQRFGLDADSQLWEYDNGFIINRASGKVFDIEKGRIRIFHRTRLCQNDRKPLESAITQRWIYKPGGYISPLYNDHYVLHISGHFGIENLDGADIILHRKCHYKDEIKDEFGKFEKFIRSYSKQKWIFEPERT
ncbi:5759_t:CDS:2 [Diversispora eburnea]|uniref:5759_t:CDS:1 n=1 Tax=Diversispora eburnea TaxID=1213867 RepID=A0A9N8V3Q7_9GLOM|nr:5759_t:CDS:2 [Diversispora eburnea]